MWVYLPEKKAENRKKHVLAHYTVKAGGRSLLQDFGAKS
jgi:hypothetical protein